jgi:hypothetical protein
VNPEPGAVGTKARTELRLVPRGTIPANADHVLGVFPREHLASALASVHRGGFGPQTRVIDGARGDAAGQLRRAALRVHEPEQLPSDALLIVVTAPGRTATVAELFSQLGAESIVFATRREEERPATERSALFAPDIRIGAKENLSSS